MLRIPLVSPSSTSALTDGIQVVHLLWDPGRDPTISGPDQSLGADQAIIPLFTLLALSHKLNERKPRQPG